ncbi:copper chaperone PCu(A)C [Microbacterium sp. ANT_H45B]|uniref:copper chaperone PCu(A)C n=1 Tax=Microbacterium TaxID=33882 RepID=UPI0011EEFBAC|nr:MULTISPECIES: copper chaperone PCu(A)C [Microbacterium]KAA0960667.1 copper chaperone PCu(A)C [Microbacterium sp. ANT_H45B]MCP1430279.1 copper(I)-binding protein [Microbacterium foliorum]
MNTTPLSRMTAILTVSLLALTGCAAGSAPAETKSAPAGDVVTIDDAWVKAADDGMSAAFGVLSNSGDEDVTVVSVSSPSSDMLELHETVENESGEMVMREIEGGFVIPAGSELTLEPGGNHIMLMDLTAPLLAGDEATFTLTFSDDSTYEFTAPVKDYSGANENYEDGSEHEEGMDH